MQTVDPEDIELNFLRELKQKVGEAYAGEEVMASTVWMFLDGIEKEKAAAQAGKQPRDKTARAWKRIEVEYDTSKRAFSKRIKGFVSDDFKRHVILRDIAHALTKFFGKGIIQTIEVYIAGKSAPVATDLIL